MRQEFTRHENIELVVSSPLSRAIFTAVEGFKPAFDRHPTRQLVLLPDLQEISDFPCDVGSDVDDLKARVQALQVPVDWEFVNSGWNSKVSKFPCLALNSSLCACILTYFKYRVDDLDP